MESFAELPPAPALSQRRAVIDVGTNSVKLLVGDVAGTEVTPVFERGEQTRLGEGFFASQVLSPAAIARTAEAVASFQAEATQMGARSLRVIATAAAREARNGDALRDALRSRTGLEVEVLSGAAEAEMGFRGVCSNPRFARGPILVTDLGGGSTEFIVGENGVRDFSQSFPLGAVRLLESLAVPPNPSAADRDRCRTEVDRLLETLVAPRLRPALARVQTDEASVRFVGVGGTAVMLARMANAMTDFDRDRIEGTRLTAADLSAWVERLWALPLVGRRRLPGLPPERADVILTGAAVYERILGTFGLAAFVPSTRGLRFAALLDTKPTRTTAESRAAG